jgi:hypothetical protein
MHWERNQENDPIHNILNKYLGINLTKKIKTSIMKTINPWRNKLNKTVEDRKPGSEVFSLY